MTRWTHRYWSRLSDVLAAEDPTRRRPGRSDASEAFVRGRCSVTTRTVERWTAALRTSSRVAGMSKVLPRCRCQTVGGSVAASVSSASPHFVARSRSSAGRRAEIDGPADGQSGAHADEDLRAQREPRGSGNPIPRYEDDVAGDVSDERHRVLYEHPTAAPLGHEDSTEEVGSQRHRRGGGE